MAKRKAKKKPAKKKTNKKTAKKKAKKKVTKKKAKKRRAAEDGGKKGKGGSSGRSVEKSGMREKDVLEIIEEAAGDGRAELDLSGQDLTLLPAEIWQLNNLTELNLHGNRLTSVHKEMEEKELLKIIEEAARDGRTELDLSNEKIKSLPVEIGQLKNLKVLDLSGNSLTWLPTEISKLSKLERLDLSSNKINVLPTEIGQLSNLQEFDICRNELKEFPVALTYCNKLKALRMGGEPTGKCEMDELPPEIRRLKKLSKLDLTGNCLTRLPCEIGLLTNLRELVLAGNWLSLLPSEIGSLHKLVKLDLEHNCLERLPKEINKLVKLKCLYISDNKLRALPRHIGKLKNLRSLRLDNNRRISIGKEIAQLTSLEELSLCCNGIMEIPTEFGNLGKLKQLNLFNNKLKKIPEELGQLSKLIKLDVSRNPLTSPQPEVVNQGTKAVLAYLREQLKAKKRQWISKLLLVGEGGVGKTSLLRALKREEFKEGLETTHGIGVEKLELGHPREVGVTMELNTWDFGGQQIYHATHQFFLTNRSLFVLVWDARHGWEAGKLYNWLDRIQAKAPESPVMIVAAHIDERDADLPLDDLKRKYPQIEGNYKVSNKTGTGIEKFREKLAEVTADLPLMGEEWPASWLDAANEIRDKEESYISPKDLYALMAENEIKGESTDVLVRWLHELGDILYFKDDEELNDLVILNPEWVTKAISYVLESKEVIKQDGIFTHQHMDELWTEIDENIKGHFLRLMERFDLSYRTLEDREISLVVERLPLKPPEYEQQWKEIKEREACKEISMKYYLSSVPAGIPTWFIARSHRFTTHTHWRMGALFADSEERNHLGLIEAYPHDRYLRLTVRGSVPQNFFVLLRDGLELTLKRFPGLKIKRIIPCQGHEGKECKHEFDFRQLEKAVERKKPILEIQCPETFEDVSVPGLLFGLHWSTQSAVITRIDDLEDKVLEGQEAIVTELRELRELTQREFLNFFNREQRLAESHCPNVFTVLPKEGRSWLKNLLGQKMVLQLYCQEPGQWHPAVEGAKGGRYEIKKPSEFFVSMGPYILKLAKVIKYAAPVGVAAAGAYAGPVGAVMGAKGAKDLAGQIKLMEELAKKLAVRDYIEAELLERTPRQRNREAHTGDKLWAGGKAERIEGMELRMFRQLLDEVDEQHEWGGLQKVLTPEGHYLWLCEEHAEKYRK